MRQVVFNRKGGVGKSSIVCNLAAVSAARGQRTLIVDLDPQANASHYLLGPDASEAKPNLTNFFEESLGFRLLGSEARSWVHPTPFENLEIVPTDRGLAELQTRLEREFEDIDALVALLKVKKGPGRLKTNYLAYEDTAAVIG